MTFPLLRRSSASADYPDRTSAFGVTYHRNVTLSRTADGNEAPLVVRVIGSSKVAASGSRTTTLESPIA
jgi:hypothetical protein